MNLQKTLRVLVRVKIVYVDLRRMRGFGNE